MLKLDKITKKYGDVEALKGVSLTFRKNEFVSILGPSGCGKTTMLNIIGGLDRYTSGDLNISGISTKNYKDRDWDSYRNSSVGFVFQSYNLIPHLTVLQNVELSLKLSGISKKEGEARARTALEKVGLVDHLNKKPNQLSGGQMQRVAIARAIVNDPEIILADEPTGALDSKTSVIIMDLLKEIAQDRLVIMVTHNAELAHEYSNRIVELLDGQIISDSNPFDADINSEKLAKRKRTKMPYMTALGLSGKNLWAKKGRTVLTSFAGSIGIIGIALILALSSGLSNSINKMQSDTLATSPITIGSSDFDFSGPVVTEDTTDMNEFPTDSKLQIYEPKVQTNVITNNITQEYIDHVNKLDSDKYISIQYIHKANMNMIRKSGDKYVHVQSSSSHMGELLDNEDFNNNQYDILEGRMPKGDNEMILVVDNYNRIAKETVKELGLGDLGDKVDLKSLVGQEFKLIQNNDYYVKDEFGLYREASQQNYETIYGSDKAKTLSIVGVMRQKEDSSFQMYQPGLYYRSDLVKSFIKDSTDSEVVKAQKEVGKEYSVVSGMGFEGHPFKEADALYQDQLEELGSSSLPRNISIIPADFEAKKEIRSHLDDYNTDKKDADKITYSDMSEMITGVMETVVNTISYVLIGFSSISLVVSSLMIGIITYVSVIERTKEIGVLRSLGARKKDISRVFNAETFLIGFVSGTLGIVVTYLLTFPINAIIYNLTKTENIAVVNPLHAVILIIISIILTSISGVIPSRMAAKKDPVIALRSE
ncbi:ABC transporter ATP-binding protein/permease [Erysipelothrix rhusiopathiae]|uniref:ABC transporter ATP-binding protein/permease n=1 Tax=Erysipelothrix rhusiopathiae TaxID=1648 RepID=UPI000210B3AA|nr:ABC transporter ATP-binding protein/permease [Erysipelothrix rhusiopathiae]AGN25025.1 ABC transporter ATP-binding protein/permease [Erysipelothrix rhusiopathiae SY1027]AMS10250.1 ABC transporter [Erysipelothrix rhusiopathiae]AOO67408.1 ABC transporter [Erysipelothrix rhusiopathiae]AWU40713.1 ATP-binding cassette domain-containing protein [Erysipelothrix rhusiopathiae]MCG4436424.1 ABC transporter ATP-binding protein/permease [Erysipelothrix rhusiopathiae]